jgi:hypothetical protein
LRLLTGFFFAVLIVLFNQLSGNGREDVVINDFAAGEVFVAGELELEWLLVCDAVGIVAADTSVGFGGGVILREVGNVGASFGAGVVVGSFIGLSKQDQVALGASDVLFASILDMILSVSVKHGRWRN